MPRQVIPLEGIDKVGFIADQPAVSLPPGAWSDVNNVRFDDGAIRKFKGHSAVFEQLRDLASETDPVSFVSIQHVAYWENPNTRYYIVIDRTTVDTVWTVQLNDDGTALRIPRGDFVLPTETSSDFWQSTQFNGGFSIVINNGREAPQHITAQTGVELDDLENFIGLPNFESYAIPTPTMADPDAMTTINAVTANIIIAEGNVLLAGGLIERLTDGTVVRNLNSVVRVSDVAAPGTIPQNWNPFDTTGTADEIVIADTGLITAMRTLRGSVYVYTSDTITQLRITPQGLRSAPITKEYGGLSQTAVFEFKGQHLVIGSDDIYLFSGNPGDIKSVADGRVKNYFYSNLHANFSDDVQIIRDQAFDELWICFANLDSADGSYNQALIWNYADNVWTKRDLPSIQNLTVGPIPGAGSTRTIIPIPIGTTGILEAAVPATGAFTFNDLATDNFIGGLRDIQTFEGTATGPVSTVGEVNSDSVFLTLPNNFQPGTGASWSFCPDSAGNFYVTNQLDDQSFVGTNADGDATDLVEEIATRINDFDFVLSTASTGTEVTVVDYDAADPAAYITSTVDTVPVIDIVLSAGEGPVGDFAGTSFVGGTNAVFTGIDLLNNEGMMWIFNADTGGGGVNRNAIIDTLNYNEVGAPNALFPSLTTIVGGEYIDRFTPTGWEQDDFSGGSLNRTGDLSHQLAIRSGSDLFDVVRYTGGPGSAPTGVVEFQGTTETYTVVASGATGNQFNAGQVTCLVVGGGGGSLIPAGAAQGGAGGGGATAWVTFTAVDGDSIVIVTGDGGTMLGNPGNSNGDPGGTSSISLTRSGVTTVLAEAAGGLGGMSNGGGGAGGTHTIHDGSVITIISSGGGNGGKGGNGGFRTGPPTTGNAGGGGGAGGYNGNGGDGAQATSGSTDRAGFAPDTDSGGGAGGAFSGNFNEGGGGGGIGLFGIGADGEVNDASDGNALQGGSGSGGLQGAPDLRGAPHGGGGGYTDGNGGVGASRIVNGPGVTYATTVAGTNGVNSFVVRTVEHNLDSVPGAMLIKSYDSSSQWVFYHKDTFASGDVGYFNFNGNGPSNDNNNPSRFNGTHPTDSVFTVGNADGSGSTDVNDSPPNANSYVNYIFASNETSPGVSDPDGAIFCGTYDGNGSSSLRTFTLGWRPSRVIIKDVTNDNDISIVFTTDATGIELTQYTVIDNTTESGSYNAFEGSFEDTGFRLATNNNLWNRSSTRYVYIAFRESVPAAGLASLFNDETVYSSTDTAGLKVTTGVDVRDGGFTFYATGATVGEPHWVPNNFGTLNQPSGPDAGQRARLPRLDSHDIQVGGAGAADHFITSFQDDGYTLPSGAVLNAPNEDFRVFSFADAPGLMSTTTYTSFSTSPGFADFRITHTLGEFPRMVLIKALTRTEDRAPNNDRDYRWLVWHNHTGNGQRLSTSYQSTDGGDTVSGWLVPDGIDGMLIRTDDATQWTGGNADTYVMYAFGGKDVNGDPAPTTPATDDGTLAAGGRLIGGSSFDSFTVNLGWRPGFIMIKGFADTSGADGGWRYWSQQDNFTTYGRWDDAAAPTSSTVLTVTDTGFSAPGLQDDASYIYWACREDIPDTGALPEFSLTDFGGNLTSIPEENLIDMGSAATVTATRDALVAGINATPLPPMNWTATAVGDDQLSLTSDVYGSVGDTGATPHQITTDAVGNRIRSIDGTTTGTDFGDADSSAGSHGFEVNLGTPDDPSIPAVFETFTVCAGPDGHQGDFLATFLDDDHTIPGNGSSYLLEGNGIGVDIALNHVTGAGDTILGVVNALATAVNDATITPNYIATTTSASESATLVLTSGARIARPGTWEIITNHPVDPDGNTGTLTFNGSTDVISEGPLGPGAVEGRVDTYDPITANVVVPTGRDSFSGTDVIFSGDTFLPDSVGSAPDSFVITAAQVAEHLNNTTYDGHTTTLGVGTLMFEQATAGFTSVPYAITGVVHENPSTTDGIDEDTPATLTVNVDEMTGLDPMPILTEVLNPNVGDSMTALEIRDTIADILAPYPEFTVTTPDASLDDAGSPILDNMDNAQRYVEVVHNQFGEGRFTVDAVYTPTSNTLEVDVTMQTPDPDDTIYPLRLDLTDEDGIQDMVFLADAERPWAAGVLNEARTFLVSGGASNIFGMDLSNTFNGDSFTSYVERRNLQLEPLADTEGLEGFFMNVSGEPTFTVSLGSADNANAGLTTDLDEPYTFTNTDYKIDTRINGRLLGYRIDDADTGDATWTIDTIGVAAGKRGTR